MSRFPDQPSEIHEAMHALYRGLGPIDAVDFENVDVGYGMHPVFQLAEHFRGRDSVNEGYTYNTVRGDHLSIPYWSESGRVGVLDVCFHKGQVCVIDVRFPAADPGLLSVLTDFLFAFETR